MTKERIFSIEGREFLVGYTIGPNGELFVREIIHPAGIVLNQSRFLYFGHLRKLILKNSRREGMS